MALLTQSLRDEHKDLWPDVEVLRTTADSVGEVPLEMLRRAVDEAYDFLARHLIPHAQAEDQALYPAVQKVMGANGQLARNTTPFFLKHPDVHPRKNHDELFPGYVSTLAVTDPELMNLRQLRL
jgi:hemerythrin HHE cation binding domain-containing protein